LALRIKIIRARRLSALTKCGVAIFSIGTRCLFARVYMIDIDLFDIIVSSSISQALNIMP
jgi:hypothetical protein